MDKVFETLKPDRCVVLLRHSVSNELIPAIIRVAEGISAEEIRLSRTLVAAVVEKRNGLLLMDTSAGSDVSLADSIRLSGIKSVLAAPLENEGQVVGLIYVDCRMGHRSFEEADLRLLTSLANVAAAKIQNARLMAEAAEKKQMDREFALAREIQQRLLPENPAGDRRATSSTAPTSRPGRSRATTSTSASRSDGKIYATIADVCGKGVGPALLMASLQASFHAWADEHVGVPEMTGRLSEAISRRTGPDRFITFFLLLLDPATGEIEYTNAGHNPGLLLREDGSRRGARVARPAARALPRKALRLLAPRRSRRARSSASTPTASRRPTIRRANEFGMPRLKEFLAEQVGLEPSPRSTRACPSELEEHAAGEPFADDRTLVMIRRLSG